LPTNVRDLDIIYLGDGGLCLTGAGAPPTALDGILSIIARSTAGKVGWETVGVKVGVPATVAVTLELAVVVPVHDNPVGTLVKKELTFTPALN
jgi:hypothetical protein